jgi:hypothetical protein
MTLEDCFKLPDPANQKACANAELLRLDRVSQANQPVKSFLFQTSGNTQLFVLPPQSYEYDLVRLKLPTYRIETSAISVDFNQLQRMAKREHPKSVDDFFASSLVIATILVSTYVALIIYNWSLRIHPGSRTNSHARRAKISGDFNATKKPMRYRRRGS